MKTKNILAPISRLFLGSIFIASGLDKARQREKNLQYMKSKNIPLAPVLLTGATVAELAAGAGVLLGFRGPMSAAALGAYLIPTSLIFHNFWRGADEQEKQNQMIHFMKNLAILGGLLHVSAHGSGALSIDEGFRLRDNTPRAIGYIEVEERVTDNAA